MAIRAGRWLAGSHQPFPKAIAPPAEDGGVDRLSSG
jgi:hypothetical protein